MFKNSKSEYRNAKQIRNLKPKIYIHVTSITFEIGASWDRRGSGDLFGALRNEIEFVFVAQLLTGHVDDFLDVAAEMGDGAEQGGCNIGVEALDAAVFD